MKLIVVDDHPLEGRTIEFLLRGRRPDISYCGQAVTAEAGMTLALDCRPDIAIVDVAMPGMDGLELTRLLKTRLPQTRVIILSAYDDFSFVQSALRSGACDYILKPLDEEELFRAIDEAKLRRMEGPSGGDTGFPPLPEILFSAIQTGELGLSRIIFQGYWIENLAAASQARNRALADHVLRCLRGARDDAGTGEIYGSTVRKLSQARTLEELSSDLEDYVGALTLRAMEREDLCREPSYDLVRRAKEFIEANLDKEITLELVSREIFISPFYLSRIFKRCNGCNFLHYVTNLRLERAKHLLFSTNDTIQSIAQQVGYQECNSFRRSFKQHFGVSPREYRADIRKKAKTQR